MTLHEIEELIKTVNRNAIKAMLRNAAILGDAKATDEMKSQALENVKAIAANKAPRKSRVKPVVAEAPAMNLAQQPAIQQPVAAQPSPIQYPENLHLTPLNASGHDEPTMRSIFDALPDAEKKSVVDWHSNIKMKKSVDSLYDLFTELKKRL